MPIHAQDLARFYPLDVQISGGGFVQLVSVNGTDAGIDTVARTEFDQTDPRMPNEVTGLLGYMIRHAHTSPFEFVNMTFQVRCPLFVRAQWFRHRTGHYSEISGRYKDVAHLGAYCPTAADLRQTAPSRKQGSSDELIENPNEVVQQWSDLYQMSQAFYHMLVYEIGLSKEVARGVLMQTNFTHFYFQCDLHNLLNFIRLRTHATAQFQMRDYAEAVGHFISQAFPITYRHYQNHILQAARFSADELEFLQVDEAKLRSAEYKLGKGRYEELLEKLGRVRAANHH